MNARSLMAAATSIALEAPAPAPRVAAARAHEEPQSAPSPAVRIDATAVAVLLLGAVIIVSFQSFGSVSFFDRNLAARFDGWPKAGMYDYVYWFGSSIAWLFVLPVLVIALMPRRRLRDFGFGLGDWRFGVRAATTMYAMMLPVLAVASFRPNFIEYYPMSGWGRDEISLYAAGGSPASPASASFRWMRSAIQWGSHHSTGLTGRPATSIVKCT